MSPGAPFSRLFRGNNRSFDVAEIIRCYSASKRGRACYGSNLQYDRILNGIRYVIDEVESKASQDFENCDMNKILGLYELIGKVYEIRPNRNFLTIYVATGLDTIDKTPRSTSAKGILRWAFEKYFIFKLAECRLLDLTRLRGSNNEENQKYRLDEMRRNQYFLPSLIFGSQATASVVKFWIRNNEVHYDIVIHPRAVLDMAQAGVPYTKQKDVVAYLLKIATMMLNPLESYGGEPAVKVANVRNVNVKLCYTGQLTREIQSYARKLIDYYLEKYHD